jgi:signal peptidase II
LVIALVLAADQVSKHLVRTLMVMGESIPNEGIVRITYIINTGGAFGLFPNQTLLLTIAALAGVALMLFFYRTGAVPGGLARLSLALMLGGAIGNLIDRVRAGYVVDFVALGFWPVFNVADASMVMGITLLLAVALLVREPGHIPWKRQRAEPPARPPPEVAC